jgi:adenine-specific DNA-methyltransferase
MSLQTPREDNRRKLQDLLRDLFQFDAADLNFGIYRILNQRRDYIEQFIEEELLDTVEDNLGELIEAEREEIEEKLDKNREAIKQDWPSDVFNSDGSLSEEYADIGQSDLEEYQELWEAKEQMKVAEETEARIFNDLYRFFSRYYDDGDFHTKRRISSREAKYYVPYNGEETHFHYANSDQYYVKTGEHFTDYRFEVGDWSIEFVLQEADVPQDNVKGDSRYFVLGRGDPVSVYEDENRAVVRFQYRQITEDEADQIVEDYNEATGDNKKSFTRMSADKRCEALQSQTLENLDHPRVKNTLTEEDNGSTKLFQHLNRYVSENSMDYFVHKDLEEFLEGELDFYIQNEILEVDGLLESGENTSPPILRARTVRDIAKRIISFLSQIEDFQKRLFEKKKFVVQTDYMVTIDQVTEELYEDILDNQDQLEQWREVYSTEEWDETLTWRGEFDKAFLNNHPHIMIDTGLFSDEFKYRLLESFEDIEDSTRGLLINSENFQALNLLKNRYQDDVNSIYIDPPYNTGNEFLYKDNYRHSSWLSMINDRVVQAKQMLSDDGLFFSSIDDNELSNYTNILDTTFGEQLNLVVVQSNPKGRGLDRYLAKSHDYLLAYAQEPTKIAGIPKADDQIRDQYRQKDQDGRYRRQPLRNTHREFNRETRPNLWYPLYVDPENRDVFIEEAEQRVEVYPVWDDGHEGCWTWDQDKAREDIDLLVGRKSGGRWKVYRKDYATEGGSAVTYTPKTIWDDNDLRTDYAQQLLDDMMGNQVFRAPKPPALIKRAIQLSTGSGEYVLDFFAGSGTTAHAVIQLNRERNMENKYILCDMGEHLFEVAKPRIQKLVYTGEWDDGIPENRNGASHMIKYVSLESYEDALNNISLEEPTSPQQTLVEEEMDGYTLNYMLDFESEGSPTLLPKGTFDRPFEHELQIEQNGTGREPTTVDLVETFHYLIGAEVRKYWREIHQERKYVVTECDVGNEKTLIIWRRKEDLSYEDEKEWVEQEFDPAYYDRVYVNGESYIEQSEPLEIEFRERMEATPNV